MPNQLIKFLYLLVKHNEIDFVREKEKNKTLPLIVD
jgi:hypothetical protein